MTMGATLGKSDSPKKGWMPETKIEAKMVEAMQRRESHGSSVKSFNTIILKFPKIDESLRKCKAIFEQFGRFPLQIYSVFKLCFLSNNLFGPESRYHKFHFRVCRSHFYHVSVMKDCSQSYV